MIRKTLLLLLLFFTVFLTEAQDASIRQAIVQQVETYPASTLKDIYKNFFQDAFGPGHLMSNAPDAEQRMRNYLEQECEEAKKDINPCPDYELTGSHVMKSAAQFSLPKVEDWKQEWIAIEKCIKELGYQFPDQAQDSAAIMNILEQGQYASHHSIAYNEAYHPHYRLIEKTIFEKELLPRLYAHASCSCSEIR